MSLRQYQYFSKVAQTQHMSQAAIELHISQPSLSHAINELEKTLGAKLFEKQGRNIVLTKYGSFILPYVNRALDELDRGKKALSEMVSPEHGHIDLAFIYTLGSRFVPELIVNFKQQDSYKNIDFSFQQGNSIDIIDKLKAGVYDIAFCSKIENDSELEFIPLVEERLVCITPIDHPLANLKEIDLKQIKEYPIILFNKKSGISSMILDMLNKSKIKPNIVCEVEEDHAMSGFVANGYGIGILPHFATLENYKVKVIPIVKPKHQRFIYLVTVKNRYLSLTTHIFKDYVIAYAKANYLNVNRMLDY